MKGHTSCWIRPVSIAVAAAVAVASLFLPAMAAADPCADLESYRDDMDRIVGSPGASRSIEAGFINPAAWPIQERAGLYLAWEDRAGATGVEDFRGVLSFSNLAFAMKRLSIEDCAGEQDHYDYTLGLGFGDRSHAFGLSYSWTRGGWPAFPTSERVTFGDILRWRPISVGLAKTWDLDSKDGFYEADIGLRPYRLGSARLTLFADAVLRQGDDLEDTAFGYGIEAHLIPGLSVAARARDTGELSLRIDLGLQSVHPSYRQHLDDESERRSSTYAVEFTEGPHLGQALALGKKHPEVDLRGSMAYRTYRLFDDRRRFVATLEELNGYAEDPQVAGVVVNLSGFRATPALIWELRGQLAGLRERGKTVVMYIDNATLPAYALASVADEIWMDPYGIVDIRGINIGRTYYRRLLEQVGIGFEEWRYFKYKSAMETFSRTSLSEADREQIDAFVEDVYDEVVRMITSARSLSSEAWDRLVDEKGILLAHEAREAGLVDSIGDYHEAKERAKEVARRSSGDARVTELAGVAGDPVWGPEEWGEPPRIALLYAIGPCAMDEGIRGRELSRLIRKVRRDRRVKAVVLRADSPGGEPLPSDLVARELKETAKLKPVIVSQGQVAGSGGYWISMHGDSILATPVTVTGSIGVIGGHFWNDGLGEKIGTDYDHVQRGEHADALDGPVLPVIGVEIPDRPVTEEERRRAETLMRDLYRQFTTQVAEGRDMTPEEVDEVGQGRIWSGTDGLQMGLVDEIGGLWRALEMAKEASGLAPGRWVEFEEGPELGWFDWERVRPRLLGVALPFLGSGRDSAKKEILTGPAWDGLHPAERSYLETMMRLQRRPAVMMPPLAIPGMEEVSE